MKKLFAILLAMMMLTTAFAFAEEGIEVNEAGASVGIDEIVKFSLTMDEVPAGYVFDQTEVEGVMYFALIPDDDTKPMYAGSVAYSEEFVGYTLDAAALNDEQKAQMLEMLAADMNDPSVEYTKTAHGTDLIILNENGVASDYVEIVTIYDGYMITLSILKPDGDVNQEDIDNAVKALSDLWIVGA